MGTIQQSAQVHKEQEEEGSETKETLQVGCLFHFVLSVHSSHDDPPSEPSEEMELNYWVHSVTDTIDQLCYNQGRSFLP